jgi:hypothetical protein
MASFNTILSDVGHFFKKVFTSPVTMGVEKGIDVFAQTPLAALLLSPAGATLLKNSIEAIENVEMMSIAAGQQSGSGAQKAALVMQTIEQAYNNFAAAQNPPLPVTPKTLAVFVDAFVAVANSFPAGTTTAVAATTASTANVQTQAATGTLL